MPPENNESDNKGSRKKIIIISIVASVAAVVALVLTVYCVCRRCRSQSNRNGIHSTTEMAGSDSSSQKTMNNPETCKPESSRQKDEPIAVGYPDIEYNLK